MTPIASVHDLDGRVVDKIIEWARGRLGTAYAPFDDFPYAVDLPGPDAMLFVPWSVYDYFVDDRRIVDHYLAEREASLSSEERAWLDAQSRVWLSAWEMLEIEPGIGVRARDMLTGEERFVREIQGSRDLRPRDVVLARAVDFGGASVFCGMHPRRLPPDTAAAFVAAAREALAKGRRARKTGPLPSARLREPDAATLLIAIWQDAVDELLARPMPTLQNTDGDPLLITIDHFTIAKGARAEVDQRLRALPGAEADEEAARGAVVIKILRAGNAMHKDWDNTVVGTVRLSASELKLETNSIKRADALRRLVEAACGELVGFRAREHEDPASQAARGERKPAPYQPSPEEMAMVREMKARHYAAWLGTKIPALEDRTPRQAMKTVRLRAKLDVLLKQMENHEESLPEGERFDVSALRRELGLA